MSSHDSSPSTASLTPSTRFCAQCGSAVEYRIPDDDSRVRAVCPSCGFVHYDNPKMVVGTIPIFEGKVLLCRRAIEPGYGLWTLPAGFMENGESTLAAALRETAEEACARVDIDALFALINIPGINQVHLFYRGQLCDTNFSAGQESLETRLFDEADIPWESLAFQSVSLCLQRYFDDRRSGRFALHEATLGL